MVKNKKLLIKKQSLKTNKSKKINIKNAKKLKIGFLGPRGTFSHQAVLEIFSSKVEFISLETIKEIFEKIDKRKIDFGVVPAENTTNGLVSETINNLIEYPLKVSGSYCLPIHQCLLSFGNSRNKLKIIKTHPQAIAQCQKWFEKKLLPATFESASSTTAPILESLTTKNKDIDFIANEIASSEYGLNVLAKNIEDIKDNITKFYIISQIFNQNFAKKLKAKKTIILLAAYNQVGILRDILNVFAEKNLNLTALHSIPSRQKPWDYFFFLEVEISIFSGLLKSVIKELKKFCPIIKIIGAS